MSGQEPHVYIHHRGKQNSRSLLPDVVVCETVGELRDGEHLTTTLIIGTKSSSVLIESGKKLVAELKESGTSRPFYVELSSVVGTDKIALLCAGSALWSCLMSSATT